MPKIIVMFSCTFCAISPTVLTALCMTDERPDEKERGMNDTNTFALCVGRPVKISTYQRDVSKRSD